MGARLAPGRETAEKSGSAYRREDMEVKKFGRDGRWRCGCVFFVWIGIGGGVCHGTAVFAEPRLSASSNLEWRDRVKSHNIEFHKPSLGGFHASTLFNGSKRISARGLGGSYLRPAGRDDCHGCGVRSRHKPFAGCNRRCTSAARSGAAGGHPPGAGRLGGDGAG